MKTPVVFGLVNQGHVPTIERLLAEGKNWDEIGSAIGWCPSTAREHYERHLRPLTMIPLSGDTEAVCPLLAKAVEMLRKFGNKSDTTVWDRNAISELIFQSEVHLKSKPLNIHPILKAKDER